MAGTGLLLWPVAHRGRDHLGPRSALGPQRGPFRPERFVHDLGVQLEDRVDEHLRSRWAARQVHVHRDDVIHPLHDRVVVEHPPAGRAHAHREHPTRFGHLVVDLPQHRGHLVAHPPGHDHQVGLPRRRPEDLHPETGQVVTWRTGGHHLDGATGQPEGGGPQRRLPGPVDQFLDAGEQDAAGQLLLESHVSSSPSRRVARRKRRRSRESRRTEQPPPDRTDPAHQQRRRTGRRTPSRCRTG
jgi:hypothetical protein